MIAVITVLWLRFNGNADPYYRRWEPEYDWREATRLWPALRIEELIALDETGMARNEWLFLLDQSPYENKLQLGW